APQQEIHPSTKLKFGILSESATDRPRVMTETRVIPIRVNTERPYFGFEVARTDEAPYRLQTIAYLPDLPSSVMGDLVGLPEDYKAGIPSQAIVYKGDVTMGYRFDEGDPLGRYRIVVYINGAETETF